MKKIRTGPDTAVVSFNPIDAREKISEEQKSDQFLENLERLRDERRKRERSKE